MFRAGPSQPEVTDDERRAVSDWAADEVSNHIGEGILVDGSGDLSDMEAYSTHDYIVEWRWDELLPAFKGLLVRATYNREAGSNVIGIWGLRSVT